MNRRRLAAVALAAITSTSCGADTETDNIRRATDEYRVALIQEHRAQTEATEDHLRLLRPDLFEAD